MMAGYFASLAALELARTEARLQAEEAQRQAERHEQLRQQNADLYGDVIDVEAREVPDVQALPAPPDNNAPPIRDQVGTTERDKDA